MNLGNKIRLGFGIILLLLVLSGGISYYTMQRIQRLEAGNHAIHEDGARLHQAELDHYQWINAVSDLFLHDNVTKLEVQTDHQLCNLGKWIYSEEGRKLAESNPKIAALLEKIKQPHKELHESAKQIDDLYTEFDHTIDAMLAERWIDHLQWSKDLGSYLLGGKQFTGSLNAHQCAFGQWYYQFETKDQQFANLLKKWERPHEQLHYSAQKITEAYEGGEKEQAVTIYQGETLPALQQLTQCYEETMSYVDNIIESNNKALELYESETQNKIQQVVSYLDEIHETIEREEEAIHAKVESFENFVNKFIPLGILFTLIVGFLLAFFLSGHIAKILRQLTSSLSGGAEELYTASTQISTASQQLAEGASEQAASLQETSASLEEITSMTKNNADNAHQANQLMGETKSIVKTASASMKQMDQSMREISTAGQEIGNIIKTIDEIAFQTNLLALNAAVEAARAGEAGKGFAVVADEVRNLAQRAAEAAKNTSAMIEDTVRKINDGSQLAKHTFESFEKVTDSSGKVAGLVSEIAAASKEQSQGIDQVNVAISQMDKVTQQNAGNAEQSASASRKLHEQSEGLREVVEDLTRLVGGHISSESSGNSSCSGPINNDQTKFIPKNLQKEGEKRGEFSAAPAPGEGKLVKPEEVIPLDDDGFEDFNG